MIQLIILFFLCRAFYRLAVAHHKAGWLYVVSAVLTVIVWAFLIESIFLNTIQLWRPTDIALMPRSVAMLLGDLSGLLMCWIYYTNLKETFRKSSAAYWPNGWII